MECMDGSVPQDLLTQQGWIPVLRAHCPSAVGWQPASLAGHHLSSLSFSICQTNKQTPPRVVRLPSNSVLHVCDCSYQALGPHQALERTVRRTECLLARSSVSRVLSSSPLRSVGQRRIPSLRSRGRLPRTPDAGQVRRTAVCYSFVLTTYGVGHCTPCRPTWGLQLGTK